LPTSPSLVVVVLLAVILDLGRLAAEGLVVAVVVAVVVVLVVLGVVVLVLGAVGLLAVGAVRALQRLALALAVAEDLAVLAHARVLLPVVELAALAVLVLLRRADLFGLLRRVLLLAAEGVRLAVVAAPLVALVWRLLVAWNRHEI